MLSQHVICSLAHETGSEIERVEPDRVSQNHASASDTSSAVRRRRRRRHRVTNQRNDFLSSLTRERTAELSEGRQRLSRSVFSGLAAGGGLRSLWF